MRARRQKAQGKDGAREQMEVREESEEGEVRVKKR